jgi:hypothetical protein
MTGSRRFPVGPLIAAVGAIVLLVSLFLDWYEEFSAWTVFEVLDLVLAAVAIASLLSLLRELGLGPVRRAVIGAGALLPLAGVALVVVVSQVLNHPPAADDFDKEFGIWLALAASIVMLAGAVLASTRISLALDVEPRPGADPDAPTVAQPDRPEGPPP